MMSNLLRLSEIAIISSGVESLKFRLVTFNMQKNTRYNEDKYNSHLDTKSFLIAYLAEYRISSKSNSIACPL